MYSLLRVSLYFLAENCIFMFKRTLTELNTFRQKNDNILKTTICSQMPPSLKIIKLWKLYWIHLQHLYFLICFSNQIHWLNNAFIVVFKSGVYILSITAVSPSYFFYQALGIFERIKFYVVFAEFWEINGLMGKKMIFLIKRIKNIDKDRLRIRRHFSSWKI